MTEQERTVIRQQLGDLVMLLRGGQRIVDAAFAMDWPAEGCQPRKPEHDEWYLQGLAAGFELAAELVEGWIPTER